MSFNWTEYLQLAQQLVGQEITASEEAKQRTAISRAYYAVYNQARHFARQHDFQDDQQGNHRTLINYYLRESRREWRNVGVNLERLRDLRNKADYSIRFERLTYETSLALKYATSLLDQINSLRNRFPPLQS